MKFIYVYSPHNEIERNMTQRLKSEIGSRIVAEYDYQSVKDILPVRTTPAFIIIREDLQGDELLDGDPELRITMEAYKIDQEEDLNIRNKTTDRLDYMVSAEKSKAVEAFKNDIKADIEASPDVVAALPQVVKVKLGLE